MICGGTMPGNCATGRPCSETRPPRTVTSAITIATMGRRMKKAAISAPRSCGRRRGRDVRLRRHTGAGRELPAIDDDAVAGLEALRDNPARADPVTEGHRLDLHRAIGRDDAQ